MINSNAYSYINVLEKAADAANRRYTVISHNISNVTTPHYKRKDVAFENYLLTELTGGDTRSLRKKVSDVELGNINSTVYTDFSNLSYRLDGNNVDIDTEEVELVSAKTKYDGIMSALDYQFSMIKGALQK